jgi:transposase
MVENVVRVYDLQKECIRIDTTSIKRYAGVNEQGLLQYGHSKDHRPDFAQLKLVLASLDPLGMPIATEVISGEHADDPVYFPIIARVREGLKKKGLLYVGDCNTSNTCHDPISARFLFMSSFIHPSVLRRNSAKSRLFVPLMTHNVM